jgi:hypothetical protein
MIVQASADVAANIIIAATDGVEEECRADRIA